MSEIDALRQRTAASQGIGPSQAEMNDLVALYSTNRHAEAEALARRIIQCWPDHQFGWKALGTLLEAQQRYAEALPVLQQALTLSPSDPETHNTLGVTLQALGRLSESEASYRRALEHRPDYLEAHINLGNALQAVGRSSEVEASYRRALELKPDYHEGHNSLGNVLQVLGQYSDAEASYRRAIELKADYPEAYYGLGNAQQGLGRLLEAETSFQRALELIPEHHQAHNNLGNVLQRLGRLSEAEQSYRRALELKPEYHEAHNNLGVTLNVLGQVSAAIASYRRALELNPDTSYARSNLLLTLNYADEISRAELFDEHLAWARQHEDPLVAQRRPHTNVSDPQRRLRVGYVSPDFRRHSVAYFIEPVLSRHDRGAFEVFCYSNVIEPDRMTQRLMGLADFERSIVGMSDERAAEQIRADGIDILVDLAGHTANGRLGVFALKPAPVQVAYLGYPNTSGLSAIDWRLTDIHADPPGEGDEFYTERLLRLPETFLCYQPADEAPDVQPPPSVASGRITFGSFNLPAKVTPEVIRIWAQLLDHLPGSRLLLKGHGIGDKSGRSRLLGKFSAHGIGGERLMLVSKVSDFGAHLALYHDVDIGLDPFPYHGTTTTFEALWMGVPVVSLVGDRHTARVGASILGNLGLGELIAKSEEEYVTLAAGLATDSIRLASLRETMRARMRVSPLLDGARLTRSIEAVYRWMWELWCADAASARLEEVKYAPLGEDSASGWR